MLAPIMLNTVTTPGTCRSDYLNVSAAIPNGPGSSDLRRDGLRCLLAAMDKLSCLRGGTAPPGPSPTAPRGLLPHEFDHWLAGAQAGATRRRRDWQRLLQQEAALGTGRRVQSRALSGAVSGAEAGAGEAVGVDLEVPLLPAPVNTIQVRDPQHAAAVGAGRGAAGLGDRRVSRQPQITLPATTRCGTHGHSLVRARPHAGHPGAPRRLTCR